MTISIRPAIATELPLLAAIEVSAASCFALLPELESECDYPTLPIELLRQFEVFVAVNDTTGARNATLATERQLVGFIALRLLDGTPFVAKVSVLRQWQQQGVGKALLRQLEARAREICGQATISLTTYRDVPWNGVWYSRMGYKEVLDEDVGTVLGAEHFALLSRSRLAHNHEAWAWVAMAKPAVLR